MATGNNRKENTFKSQLPNPFIEEELPASIDEADKAKGKKDNPSTSTGYSSFRPYIVLQGQKKENKRVQATRKEARRRR